jgi:phage shock protein A
MKVTDHETYQKFEPAEGSRLYELIAADVEAINALAQVDEAIDDINRRLEEAAGVIDGMSWDGSDFAETRQAILDRQALAVMAERAAEERQRRINAQLATRRAVQSAINPLQHWRQKVEKGERLKTGMAAHFTDGDQADLEKAGEMLTDARERLLEPA